MKKYILNIAISVIFFCGLTYSISLAEENCSVTPNNLSMNLISMPEAGDSIEFAVDAVSSCQGDTYYYFSYCPDYGTATYNTPSARWINMSDGTSTPSFTTSNRMRYTFENPGNYIVVAWTLKEASIPQTIPMVGTSLTIGTESGNGPVTHPSDFSGYWKDEYIEDGEPQTDIWMSVQQGNRVVFKTICDDDFVMWQVNGSTMISQVNDLDEDGSYTIDLNATINSDNTITMNVTEDGNTIAHTLKKIAPKECQENSTSN